MKNNMKRTVAILGISLFMLIFGATSMLAEVFKDVYRGTIAGKNVRVELYIDNNDYSVWGSYYYMNANGKKTSGTMNLSGWCNPIGPARNYYSLTETYNGTYTGSWETNYNAETGRMTGTMTNSKGNSYSINLRD